jgi:hypothetical protein
VLIIGELRHQVEPPRSALQSQKPTTPHDSGAVTIPKLGELRHKVTNGLLSNPVHLWGFNSPCPL